MTKGEWIATISIALGILVALYAVYIDYKALQKESYEALCDISEQVSCTKILTSSYSHLLSQFGIVPKDSILDQSNARLGLVFYAIQAAIFVKFR